MSFWDSEENCEQYIKMAEGYNGRELIERMLETVPKGSKVLELGMGPGVDLDILRETYKVTGTDFSDVFVKRYKKTHPQIDVRQLDATTMESISQEEKGRFDAIFSNKVLQHLTKEEMKQSLARQVEVLAVNGHLFHALWLGDKEETMQGLLFTYYTKESLELLLPKNLSFVDFGVYTEMNDNDSIWVLLQRTN